MKKLKRSILIASTLV